MAQLKYKEEQRLRQWDFMALIGVMIIAGVVTLIEIVLKGAPNRNLLVFMALAILVLSGLFYYLNSLRLITKYSEKSIKLSMMPVGTVKRKIKWEDVVESEIVDTPRESRLTEWTNQLSSLDRVVSGKTSTCLHLKLKNNEEINIGCTHPEELKEFVQQVKDFQPNK
ncbi:MAG TPA: hypothetical protein VJ508_11120 [Saprospiraceae bacterium]|nr:hypothetical protein [Saprospiraceae bacterium]